MNEQIKGTSYNMYYTVHPCNEQIKGNKIHLVTYIHVFLIILHLRVKVHYLLFSVRFICFFLFEVLKSFLFTLTHKNVHNLSLE